MRSILLPASLFLMLAGIAGFVINLHLNTKSKPKPPDTLSEYIACNDRFLQQSKLASKYEARFDSLASVWRIAYRAEAWESCKKITGLMEKVNAEKQIELDKLIRISDTCKSLHK